jgi:hypothetical protein
VFPKGDDVSTSSFGRRFSEFNIVQDEQGNNVTFVSKNHPVLGGGLVHVVNAVSAGRQSAERSAANQLLLLLLLVDTMQPGQLGYNALAAPFGGPSD